MFEWIRALSAWLQEWMSAEAGLWGLFLSAFVSATVLPGSSEVVMAALLTAYPHLAWQAFGIATLGNVLALGADPYDYSVNYVGASVRYYFGPRKVELPE